MWKKDCFAWEYKGKKKNLDEAYKQLLRYRESLLNPPLLVVCDFDRYIIKTNFNGTVQEVHEFTNDQIDRAGKSSHHSAPCSPIPRFSNRNAPRRKSPKISRCKSPKLPNRFKAAKASNLPTPKTVRK